MGVVVFMVALVKIHRIASGTLLAALLFGCSKEEPADPLAGRASAQLDKAQPTKESTTTGATAKRLAEEAPSGPVIPPGRVYPAEQPSSSAPFDGTVGIVEEKRNGAPATLRSLRSARHEGYDRVVFEFEGDVPGYHLEYIDRPVRACGSGDVVPVAGDGWLEVRLSPANAHDESGKPTVSPAETDAGLPTVKELQRTCDFEAVTTYVLGVGSPNPYRVLSLEDPPRLVVDVRHDR